MTDRYNLGFACGATMDDVQELPNESTWVDGRFRLIVQDSTERGGQTRRPMLEGRAAPCLSCPVKLPAGREELRHWYANTPPVLRHGYLVTCYGRPSPTSPSEP